MAGCTPRQFAAYGLGRPDTKKCTWHIAGAPEPGGLGARNMGLESKKCVRRALHTFETWNHQKIQPQQHITII